jgi:hypothetical protein
VGGGPGTDRGILRGGLDRQRMRAEAMEWRARLRVRDITKLLEP